MVTKDEFLRFLEVEKSGQFTMWTDNEAARLAANLSAVTYLEIIMRYQELAYAFTPEESDG